MDPSQQHAPPLPGNGRPPETTHDINTQEEDIPEDPRIDIPPKAASELKALFKEHFEKLAKEVRNIGKRASQMVREARELKDKADAIVSEIEHTHEVIRKFVDGPRKNPDLVPSSDELTCDRSIGSGP